MSGSVADLRAVQFQGAFVCDLRLIETALSLAWVEAHLVRTWWGPSNLWA